MENTFCTCSRLFPRIRPCWRGKVKPPLILPAFGSLAACGAVCGAALGTGSLEISGLEKNVAVFSEAAPPPRSVKCESGPARGRRPYKGGRGGNCCSAFARQKPPHPLSNRPEIRQPRLSSGGFPPAAVDAACWEMLVRMTNHLEKLLW